VYAYSVNSYLVKIDPLIVSVYVVCKCYLVKIERMMVTCIHCL
jgi:hypothetical protein